MISWKSYIAVLTATTILCGPFFYFCGWAKQVAGCRVLRGNLDAYLAYCTQPLFGDYEHGAFVFGTEPTAIQAMRKAQVLFIGDSRVEVGFSTSQTDAFFRQRHIRYYLLGFGYGEVSAFQHHLFDEYRLDPRVLIVNADPFFRPGLSSAGRDVLDTPGSGFRETVLKKTFDLIQPLICDVPSICTGKYPSVYRSDETGQWIWHDLLVPTATVHESITASKMFPWSKTDIPIWQANAEAFLSHISTPRRCIIFTGVPTPVLDAEGVATALGQRLGVRVIVPHLTGLTTFDLSHLSAASAIRWSAVFFNEAAPTIDACLASDEAHS